MFNSSVNSINGGKVVNTFQTGLRGFHVYSVTKRRKPSIRQHVEFMREHRNPHDKFAVAGGVLLPV